MLRLGRGDGMWADAGIYDSCLPAGSFLKMLCDSVSSEVLKTLKNTAVITLDSLTFRQMHVLKNATKTL